MLEVLAALLLLRQVKCQCIFIQHETNYGRWSDRVETSSFRASLSSSVCHRGRSDTGGSGQEWSCDTAATEKPLVRAHNRVEVTAN